MTFDVRPSSRMSFMSRGRSERRARRSGAFYEYVSGWCDAILTYIACRWDDPCRSGNRVTDSCTGDSDISMSEVLLGFLWT